MGTSTPQELVSAKAASSESALRDDEFWRAIPRFAGINRETFLDYRWQYKNSPTNADELCAILKGLVEPSAHADLVDGLGRAPMSVRLTPYLLSLIEWDQFITDPLRRQYLPIGSELIHDHPKLKLDPLHEQAYSPVPGITHRHRDAVLLLTVDTCPVYCRFCTRSYMVGRDTEAVTKDKLSSSRARWQASLDYVRDTPEVEDVVLSGGDAYLMKPEQIRFFGDALLELPNVRRIRIATKGPAVSPMKLLTDHEWVDALVHLSTEGRKRQKQVSLHTHFSHPREITSTTSEGLNRLFERGLTIRNQGVLMRGVNDDAETMKLLVRRLSHMNVQSYYIYQLDMVPGVEDLRTPLRTAIELEKNVRGATAGYQTPLFIVDALGGGGKRDVHSHEFYDRATGISTFRSPNMDPDARYFHFDPIASLPEDGRSRWDDPNEHEVMIREALAETRS